MPVTLFKGIGDNPQNFIFKFYNPAKLQIQFRYKKVQPPCKRLREKVMKFKMAAKKWL